MPKTIVNSNRVRTASRKASSVSESFMNRKLTEAETSDLNEFAQEPL